MRGIKGVMTVHAIGSFLVLSQLAELPARGQAVGFAPVPAPLPSGVILDITPAVSADRRYVRLGVNASFNDILGFTTYSVPAAVGGGGAAGLNGLIGGLGGAGAGGAGAGAGARSVGLGGPTALGPPPPFDIQLSPSDPFERARREMMSPAAAAVPLAPPETKPQAAIRANSRVRGAIPRTAKRPRGSSRPRKKLLRAEQQESRGVLPESPADFVPFDW
jgi:hypothetical protein